MKIQPKDCTQTTSGNKEDPSPKSDMEKYLRKSASQPPARTSKMAPKHHGAASCDSAPQASQASREEDTTGDYRSQHGEERSDLTREFLEGALQRALAPLAADLVSIKTDVHHIGDRVETLEHSQDTILTFNLAVRESLLSHTRAMNTLLLQMEDQENRNRRRNIRLRGLPEADDKEDLFQVMDSLFHMLLGPDLAVHVTVKRVHRVLKPKPASRDNPRDIICGILSYSDTELILQAARKKGEVKFQGANVQIYKDLAVSTLQKRRLLKPLTDLLRTSKFPYRCFFQFGILITAGNRRITVRTPEDLPPVWEALHQSPVEIPSWLPIPPMEDLPPLPSVSKWMRPKPQRIGKNKRAWTQEAPD